MSNCVVPVLTDGTVTLRAHRADDVERGLEQCLDPEVQRWTTVPVPYSRADAQHFVTEVVPAGWRDGSTWGFAVERDWRYAGTVELRDEGGGRAEIAFAAHPDVRGSGTMLAACRLLLDWGFRDQGVRTVVWRANAGNWASRKLAWRLGFRHEGLLRSYLQHRGELVDAWVGTLLSTDDGTPRGTWFEVPTLEADGVRLRPWRHDDVPRIVEACADERTQQWLGRMPSPYRAEDATDWLRHLTAARANGTSICWAVVDPADESTALASISFFDLEPDVECEIGYWAHPDARGRGLVTRAMREVVRFCFEEIGVRRVTAGAAVGNAASRHVIESCGLRDWGTERLGTVVHGGRSDIVWYDLLVEEWREWRRRSAG